MQLFFNTPSAISYGILKYPKWDYVRAGLLRNLEITQHYYHGRIFSVKSNHFLVRLINNIDVSHNFELERFYDIVDAKANSIAALMKITSSLQRGSLFNGVFYGLGCPEIIITDSSGFNPNTVYDNWRKVSPVKVVTHPRSDLSLMLPNGKNTSFESGLAVISINIAMLAVQYRAFAAEQLEQDQADGNGLQTVAHFIHRFVLPNMLPTHLDYALFNRLSNLLNGAPMGESVRPHAFSLIDYTSQVNYVQQQIIEGMTGRSMEYKMIVATIPAVTQVNMEKVLTIPNNAPTRQVMWAEVLSRIDSLQTIIALGGDDSVKRNQALLNTVAREFLHYRQDRSISAYVPKDMYYDTFSKMKEIAALVGKTLD